MLIEKDKLYKIKLKIDEEAKKGESIIREKDTNLNEIQI